MSERAWWIIGGIALFVWLDYRLLSIARLVSTAIYNSTDAILKALREQNVH